ncbi:MAG: CYTH domain-containing protein [Tannerellaceae bacterium]|nr:CYTH domain-containing protein [Tannerellaceae bacterium]
MAIETERKFLVKGDFTPFVVSAKRLVQGYICSDPRRTVRIRISGEEGYITIKGMPDEKGVSRFEFEQQIPLADAEALLKLCDPGIIDKIRNYVPAGHGRYWEVDVFQGENEGLIMAELELSSDEEGFDTPAWLGEEVTGDPRYYNAMLARYPYRSWK